MPFRAQVASRQERPEIDFDSVQGYLKQVVEGAGPGMGKAVDGLVTFSLLVFLRPC